MCKAYDEGSAFLEDVRQVAFSHVLLELLGLLVFYSEGRAELVDNLSQWANHINLKLRHVSQNP